MDDKKFIDNYFAITEHFQEFLISIKKNYQTIDHIIVILSVINHTKKQLIKQFNKAHIQRIRKKWTKK